MVVMLSTAKGLVCRRGEEDELDEHIDPDRTAKREQGKGRQLSLGEGMPWQQQTWGALETVPQTADFSV
jgi:hypothetical protein